jgi:hypothetical protein
MRAPAALGSPFVRRTCQRCARPGCGRMPIGPPPLARIGMFYVSWAPQGSDWSSGDFRTRNQQWILPANSLLVLPARSSSGRWSRVGKFQFCQATISEGHVSVAAIGVVHKPMPRPSLSAALSRLAELRDERKRRARDRGRRRRLRGSRRDDPPGQSVAGRGRRGDPADEGAGRPADGLSKGR